MSLSQNTCQKPHFGPNLGLKWPKFGPENFFQPQNHQYLLDIMPVYHNMQNQQNILKKMAKNPKFGKILGLRPFFEFESLDFSLIVRIMIDRHDI